ncbi:Outer membrane efflux family protein [Pseudohaliea rubra DSM 19751]|uniref:Outer membrane efflux family protein n=2 Tax=Pseudohaliea TaxID=1341120 RepID=A0A095VPK9_9GAMM|nr:Outer membrane efflux family protein [Pseudohaliea rubra DSM 19751]
MGPVRQLASAAALLFCAACAPLGPEFQEPESDWLATWQPTLYGQVTDPDPAWEAALTQWWQRFEDPRLAALIDHARRANPGLRSAGLRVLEARAALGIASGNRYPQRQRIEGSAAVAGVDNSAGLDPDRTDTSASLGLSLAWELDFWGRFRRAVESAEAASFATITAQRDAQLLLTAEVAARYYGYKTTLRRIRVARQNVAVQARSLEITTRLFDEGQTAELDLQQAKVQYLSTRAGIPSLEIALARQRNALAALLGRPPGDIPGLDTIDDSLPAVAPQAIPALPARLLARRPDVRTAAWQAAAQSARIGIAAAELYPAIGLAGSIGWSGSSLALAPDRTVLAAGPTLRWNILNYGRLENAVRIEDARLQQALEGYRAAVLTAAREIDDAAVQVVKTAERQGDLDASLTAAERSLALATRRYQEGYSGFQRVLDAQRALAAQADRAIGNQGDHLQAVIRLYAALGGGWETATADTLLPAETQEALRARGAWDKHLDAAPAEPHEP